MASKVTVKTTFEATKVIEPIYTGGDVTANSNGSIIATSVDEEVLVLNSQSGDVLARLEGDGEIATSTCIGPNASHLVICSRSLSMRIFELQAADSEKLKPRLLRTLKPHTTPVVSSTIDATGSLLATGGAEGQVKVWDIRGGFVTHTFHGHGGVVSALAFFKVESNNSRTKSGSESILLASGGEDGKIRIWDLNTRKAIATLDSHVSVVRSLKFDNEQQLLLSASRDRTIILWKPIGWKQQKVIPALELVETAGFVPDTRFCYSGGENGVLRIWDPNSGHEVTTTQSTRLETDAIVAVVPIQESRLLMTVHQDQSLKFHAYEKLLSLKINSTTKPLPVVQRIYGNHDEIIDMACVGNQRNMLALATNTESVRLISINDQTSSLSTQPGSSFGSDVGLLEGHEEIIICLDVDWSGFWLATGAKDNTARLWRLDPETSSYTCFAVLEGHAESLGAIALPKSPPQSGPGISDPLNHPPAFLITGSQDKTIKKWDTKKLKYSSETEPPHTGVRALFTKVAHEKDINALDVSPTAPLFASASQDKTIKIWSLEDGSVTGILRGHKRGVWSAKFSPAGTPPIGLAEGGSSSSHGLLVSGSGDRTVKIWSLSSYTCLLTFEGHNNSVLKVIWLPPPPAEQKSDSDDEPNNNVHKPQPKQPLIASASSDTLIKLWSPYAPADSDHLLTTLDNHTDRVWALASPYSNNQAQPTKLQPSYPLISGAADATITFWSDTTTATSTLLSQRATERIEQDQLLQNHIHAKNYREVITLSLALNHPGRLLRVFEDIYNLSEKDRDADSITGKQEVDDVLASLDRVQLWKLLERVRDWNTNARTSGVAQRVLRCLLRRYPPRTWVEMSRDKRLGASAEEALGGQENGLTGAGAGRRAGRNKGGVGGMKEMFRAIEVYTDRHYKRTEDLMDESYLLEYTLREMDEVTGTTQIGLVNGNHEERDVIMT